MARLLRSITLNEDGSPFLGWEPGGPLLLLGAIIPFLRNVLPS